MSPASGESSSFIISTACSGRSRRFSPAFRSTNGAELVFRLTSDRERVDFCVVPVVLMDSGFLPAFARYIFKTRFVIIKLTIIKTPLKNKNGVFLALTRVLCKFTLINSFDSILQTGANEMTEYCWWPDTLPNELSEFNWQSPVDLGIC